MKIEKLALPDSAIDFLKSQGYEKLYPPQAGCIKSGLLNGKSILVSAPTASGKTLIAMLAMLSYLSKNKGKVIYLSPLRALAAEKFTEFKKLEKISIGNKIKTGIVCMKIGQEYNDSFEDNTSQQTIKECRTYHLRSSIFFIMSGGSFGAADPDKYGNNNYFSSPFCNNFQKFSDLDIEAFKLHYYPYSLEFSTVDEVYNYLK